MGKSVRRENAKIMGAVNALSAILALAGYADIRIMPIFGGDPYLYGADNPLTEIDVCKGSQVLIRYPVNDMDVMTICREILNDPKLG